MSSRESKGRAVNAVLVPLGGVGMLAALVGGGLKAFGIDIREFNSLPRQIAVGIVGGVFLLVGLYSLWILPLVLFRVRRLEFRYRRLLLQTNDLVFTPGGIRDLLLDYQASGSPQAWSAVRECAKRNERKLEALRRNTERLVELGDDSKIALVLNNVINSKRIYLYVHLLRMHEPTAGQIAPFMELTRDLQDLVEDELPPTKQALNTLLAAARARSEDLEDRMIG